MKAIKLQNNTYIDSSSIVHNRQILSELLYPIGSLYLSTNSTNPHDLFGGTWEQITDDAYLKIVTSNAGSLGGTSADHKIPINSMPKHKHSLAMANAGVDRMEEVGYSSGVARSIRDVACQYAGGGQAYYPYYLGVYVWKRIE